QSKKWVVKYQVQFTNSETQNKKITDWNALPEDLFSAKNAFFASKEVANTYTKVKLPQSFTAQNGKMAWRVVAFDQANKAIDSSRIEMYEVINAPLADRIKLISPIKGEKINNGYGLEFSWGPSIKQVANYQVQFTDRENQNKKITNWNTVSDVVFTKKDAFYASKDAGAKLKLILPATFTSGNGKIVWRVVGFNNVKQAIDSSAVEIYEVVDAPLTDRIKLVSPIDGKKISGGENLKYEWTASKKKTVKEYIIQWKYIKNKNEVSEKLFSDTDFNGSIGPFKETSFSLTTQVDQDKTLMAWRVLGIANGKMIDSSLPDYVEFVEDTSELANLKNVLVNGYNVQINQISSKDQDKFSASGKILLWEGGKEVSCSFKDLKIRPIAYFPKINKYQWAAIDGTIEINTKGMMPSNRIDLSTNKDCEGAFQLALNSITMKAKLEGAMDAKNVLFKFTKDSGTTEGKVTTKWFSNWFIWEQESSSSNKQYEFESNGEGTLAMSFANKFDGSVVLKSKSLQNLENSGIGVEFDPMGGIKVNVKKLEATTTLSGMVLVPNASPNGADYNNFIKLGIPFKGQKNLNFRHTFAAPMKWKINEDGSVWANVTETYVHLSDNGQMESKFESYNNGLNFDKFGILINLPKKSDASTGSTLNLSFDQVYNKGNGYTTNSNPNTETKNNADFAGFTTKLTKSSFKIVKNKLTNLKVEGDVYVPFLNDWAGLVMDIDHKKIQEINLDFDYQKKYYLSKDNAGGYAYITISSGRLENNAVVVSPTLSIKNGNNQGLETSNLYMCDLFIDSSGAVSYNTNFSDNSESTCEGTKRWATYYKFGFGIDKMKIKRNTIKTDAQFLFTGNVILGPNIAGSGIKEMGFTYHGANVPPNLGFNSMDFKGINFNTISTGLAGIDGVSKGPDFKNDDVVMNNSILENSIEIADDGKAIDGNYEDGAQKFGGGFKMTSNATWGDCFELGGYYEAKEPDAKQLSAKMILGKKSENGGKFSYWFFEFNQKGFVSIPIIPGILEANGFGGKAYYHMEVAYDNMGKISSMKPNSNYSLGMAAEADVRTAYDQGATIHGHVQIVTQFQGWSIDGISYFIKGDAIALNSDNPGLIQARLNGQLNWVDKYIDGKGQIWGKVHDVVCLNEGAANEDSIFFHFGADDFYMNVGTPENPITAEVMCGSGLSVGIWLGFDKKQMGFGFAEHYDSGWKGLDLGIASAEGRLISNFAAGVNVQYSPFQATGTASFTGAAYGKGCVDFYFFDGCIGGSCSVAANLTVSMPNPVVFEGSVACNVHRWIPDFSLHAKWSSNGGFSIWL
uniref:hypothetical protein n=1 Tax=Flavobacterium sp. TaxID=239 RepID=UPI0026370B24